MGQTMTGTRELRDSRSLLGDWEALRTRIAGEGYVFMRGLLDRDVVRATGRRCLGYLQSAGWTESGYDPVTAPPRQPVRAVAMRDAFGDPGYGRILADPGFNAIPFTSRMADLMAQILGPAGFCYPLKLPRIVYPTTVVPRQPGNVVHKDYQAVQDMFTCWVPLGEVSRSLGGLALRPGSHISSEVHHRPLRTLEPGWRTVDYEPGDVLVFHCLTTHAALPNHEDRMRFSAEYRWQLSDQAAPRRVVIGPNGHEIGSRLFARSPWWHSVLPGLDLFDDGSDAGADGAQRMRLPIPPSRFVPLATS
jgi:hypothetical protein